MQTLNPLSTAAEFEAVAANLTEAQCRTLWAAHCRANHVTTATRSHAASVRTLEKMGLLWNGEIALEGNRVFWLLADGKVSNPNWG